jgi:hypothetical protein
MNEGVGTCRERFGLSDRALERYLCGDLPEAERQRVQAAVDRSVQLGAYVAERRRDKEGFAALHPFAPVSARLAPRERRTPFASFWLRAATTAAALILVVAAGSSLVLRRRPVIEVRGDLTAKLTVKRQERIFEASPGVVLKTGDQIRVRVDDPVGGVVAVVGIDESGRVAIYHGDTRREPPLRLAPGSALLPDSLTLDDSRLREALVVVLATEPLAADALFAWMSEALRDPVFPPHLPPRSGARGVVLPIHKEAP